MAEIIDTHAHLCDPAFGADRAELLSSLPGRGVERVIEIACGPDAFRCAASLAEGYGFVYAAFGLHPELAESHAGADFAALEKYLAHPKCVALGEIGLDFHFRPYNRDAQLALFRRQLDMALDADLPVSLHIRDAYDCGIGVLERYSPRLRGVMHCFSGSAEIAERCVGLGMYIAFGGSLTFKNNKTGPRAAASVPIDRLLLETDCPYMAPEPFRGRRCDPSMARLTCVRLADIKGISCDDMARISRDNALRLFWGGR